MWPCSLSSFMANSSNLRAQQCVRGWRKKSGWKNHRFAVGSNFFLSRGFLTFFISSLCIFSGCSQFSFSGWKNNCCFPWPYVHPLSVPLCLRNGKSSFSWKNVYFLDFKSPRGVFGIIPSCLYNFKTISSLPAWVLPFVFVSISSCMPRKKFILTFLSADESNYNFIIVSGEDFLL